ncbi:hypothetical protein DL96DRAFT_818454 [Flagelloscypha sp. PMI_526]|nr:hypothetical protein DL96DRAFT_818454 [Flagelloscypha sp. PMI_526]
MLSILALGLTVHLVYLSQQRLLIILLLRISLLNQFRPVLHHQSIQSQSTIFCKDKVVRLARHTQESVRIDLESDSVRRKSFSTRITAAASSIGINPSDEFVRLSSSSPPRPLTVVHRKTKKASRRMDPRRRQTLRSASFFSNNSSKNDTTVFNPISRRSNSFLQNCGPGSSTRMSAANTKYQHLSRTPLQFVPIAEAEASYARVRLRKRRYYFRMPAVCLASLAFLLSAKSTEKPTCLLNSRKIKPHSDTVLSPELPSPMVEIPCAPCLKDDQATIAHGRMHTSFTSPICSQVHKPLMSRFPSS